VDNKANFKNSFGLLFLSLAVFLTFRWAILEPFIIPSGSMIPSLLINDHIVVAKWSFGLRLPFTKIWLTPQRLPKRGDVVVFSSVEKDDFYLIKRVVGLPGDEIELLGDGNLKINGQTLPRQDIKVEDLAQKPFYPVSETDVGQEFTNLQFFLETLGEKVHPVILENNGIRWENQKFIVPEGRLFMMGDNRDSSRDSRYWGYLPVQNLVGRALFVWLSCSETLVQVNYLCNPASIRWQRFFFPIQ
jgi:signal peptidase I